MAPDVIRDLVRDTLLRPREAARTILAIRWPRDALVTALALLAVLNGIFYAVTLPIEAAAGLPLPAFVHAPLAMAVFAAGLLGFNVLFLLFAGRFLGGQALLDDILAISVWLQTLRLVLQVGVTMLSFLSPGVAGLIAAIAGIWGLWVLVHFLAQAHRFASPMRALGAMVLGILGLALAMSVMLAMLGVAPPEGV